MNAAREMSVMLLEANSEVCYEDVALHKPIPLGSRVRLDKLLVPSQPTGTVVGVSSRHAIIGYIVLLDQPILLSEETHYAVVAYGTELESEDGQSNWKMELEDGT